MGRWEEREGAEEEEIVVLLLHICLPTYANHTGAGHLAHSFIKGHFVKINREKKKNQTMMVKIIML